jgi:hypothetical protein
MGVVFLQSAEYTLDITITLEPNAELCRAFVNCLSELCKVKNALNTTTTRYYQPVDTNFQVKVMTDQICPQSNTIIGSRSFVSKSLPTSSKWILEELGLLKVTDPSRAAPRDKQHSVQPHASLYLFGYT